MTAFAKKHQKLDPNIECLWNCQQACQYTGYTRSTIERLVALEQIPYIGLPGVGKRFNIRFRKSQLDAWMLARGRICKGRTTTLPPTTKATPQTAQEVSL